MVGDESNANDQTEMQYTPKHRCFEKDNAVGCLLLNRLSAMRYTPVGHVHMNGTISI